MFHILFSFGRSAVLLAALACTFSSGIGAAPLAEAEVLQFGLARPELDELARARLGDAEADVVEAGRWANPVLELARDTSGTGTETSWQFVQPLDFSGRRGLRTEAANLRRSAVQAENRGRRDERAAGLRKAFYTVLRQQEVLHATGVWVGRFAEIGGVVDKLARAGEASGYDRRRLVREQRAAEARLAESQAELERHRARLSALLGRGIDEGVAGRLLPEAPEALNVLASRLGHRPDLSALAARADAANTDKAAAQRNSPEVTLGLGGKRVDDGIMRNTGAVVSVSIPLPIFDRQQAGHRRAAAQAMAARAELGLARQAAEGELVGLHRQLSQLIAAAQRYRQDAVTPSAELVRIGEAAYRGGESTVLELLDAYKGALEAETTALELEWKAREARIEIDQLIGNSVQ